MKEAAGRASLRTWIKRIVLSLLVLIVLAVGLVQVLLWTSLPKKTLISQLEQQLGLRITAQNLSTGWLGHTTLKNVSLGLPLEERSFLNVPTLRVKHTSLPGLIFGRSFVVRSIEIDQPTVIAVQGVDGEWNIQGAAQTAGMLSDGSGSPASGSQKIPILPTLKVVDGQIDVIDNQHRQATVGPLNLDGASEGALLWKCAATIGDAVRIDAEVAPGGVWKHRVTFSVRHLDKVAGELGFSTFQADAAGKWDGQFDGDALTGRLTLDRFSARDVPGLADVTAQGSLAVRAQGSTLTLRPQKIELKSTISSVPLIRLTDGAFVQDDTGLHAQDVQVGVFGGLAILNGSFDAGQMNGDFQARWTGLELPGQINNRGSLTASLRMPFVGHPAITVVLDSLGSAPAGNWDATVQLAGTGQSWKSIDWTLTAPTLEIDGSHPIRLSQLTAHIMQRYPMVQLTELSLPGNVRLASGGAVDLQKYSWYFWLDGGTPTSTWGVPVSAWINSWGDNQLYTLQEMDLRFANLGLWAAGFYDSRIPKPLNLQAMCLQSPVISPDAPVQGRLGANFKVSGWIKKMWLDGDLTSQNLVVLKRPIGDVDLKFNGEVADGSQIDMQTQELNLFGGRWNLHVHRAQKEDPLTVALSVRNLPVDELAKFVHVDDTSGEVANADWNVTVHALNLNGIGMDHSQIAIHQLSVAGLSADEVKINPQLHQGVLRIPIEASSGSGRAAVTFTDDLNDWTRLKADLEVNRWPRELAGGARVELSVAKNELDFDLGKHAVEGAMLASAELQQGNQSIGHAQLSLGLSGRRVSLRKLDGNVLGGDFEGTADIDFDRPLQATGRFQWRDLDAAQVAAVSPELKGFSGKYSGTITLAPAIEPRPLAPVRIDLNVATTNARFRTLEIGDDGLAPIHAVAFADTDRIVLDHCDIDLAGGRLRVWGRLARDFGSKQLTVEFDQLQLDELARLGDADAKPVPGLLSGSLGIIGGGADISQVNGSGKIYLTHSDLGNFRPVAVLYNAMNLGRSSAPNGAGSVSLRFEQNTLAVDNFSYFNRGVDARGLARIGPFNWDHVSSTPIAGQIAGTIRPLKGSRLLFFSDFDQIFSALQGNLTTVNITGTLGNYDVRQGLVDQMAAALKELLVGVTQENLDH